MEIAGQHSNQNKV